MFWLGWNYELLTMGQPGGDLNNHWFISSQIAATDSSSEKGKICIVWFIFCWGFIFLSASKIESYHYNVISLCSQTDLTFFRQGFWAEYKMWNTGGIIFRKCNKYNTIKLTIQYHERHAHFQDVQHRSQPRHQLKYRILPNTQLNWQKSY